MKTVKLKKNEFSVNELIALAREGAVVLVSEDGKRFVLEEEDDFDREAAQLGNSEHFARFLVQRASEQSVISIEQFAKDLGSTDT